MNLSFYTKSRYWILILSIMVGSWSCNKDDLELFIDAPLQEYFNRFQAEGATRNVIVDYEASRVSGYLRIITSSGVIGQCAHNDKKPNTVIIDKIYWASATELEKEFVVFHELGHCVLNREHTDVADNDGDCVSIMTSGTGNCDIDYTVTTRTALLDELFK